MDSFAQAQDTALDATSVSFSVSEGLASFLATHNLTIAATSYQSGRLYLLGSHPSGGIMLSEEYFSKAMGLCVDGQNLHLIGDRHLIHLKNSVPRGQVTQDGFEKSYAPVTIQPTGDINGHDLAMAADGRVIIVNTRFNCLSTIDDTGQVLPVWTPSFLNKDNDGDRCHLNGLTIDQGDAAFVTGIARSCRPKGWRPHRIDGGFVMDVQSNRIVCDGLSMPHSPRIHDQELWICNSGTGELGLVDLDAGKFLPFAFLPGFIRGLAFHNQYAFVGLSRPRHARFDGLPLHDRLADATQTPWTGVTIIDTTTGETAGWFQINGPVTELYDVAVLPDTKCAAANGVLPQFYEVEPEIDATRASILSA